MSLKEAKEKDMTVASYLFVCDHKERRIATWWGEMDSNHRSRGRQIYSLFPLAARESPHILELVNGIEPSTY